MADTSRRPTIAELEAILMREDNPPIEILPDGSIAVGVGRPYVAPKIFMLNEVLGGDY